MTALSERKFVPAAPLRPWISEVCALFMPPVAPRALTRLPNGAACLVLCAAHVRGVQVMAVGPNTRASFKLASAIPLYTRFTLRPGKARALFGVALHELTDRAVPIDELWGSSAERLRGELARAGGELDRTVRVLEGALLDQLEARRGEASRGELVGRAVSALEAGAAEPQHITRWRAGSA